MVGTKEFYDLLNEFEKASRDLFYGHLVERENIGKQAGVFYKDGYVNSMFIAYMHGYAYAKCLFRDGE